MLEIGAKIKSIRQQRNMTLVELADKTGIQIATLSRIENLKMTGTVESHINIAKALETDIATLYSDIIKEDETADLTNTKPIFDVSIKDTSSLEILTNNALSRKMLPVLIIIGKGDSTSKEQDKFGSEKFIYVLEGEVEIKIEDKTYPLSSGNSIYFNSSKEHYIINKGKKTARLLSVTTIQT
ncbi:MAG: helix-turn-helix transcriptional regulator [Candidatus Omnitrophica bacterium]|nr:helix-turn-helix transcriptional regulator [Candidatus Omnitrophota bacterium]